MTFEQLRHAIRAASTVSNDLELYVFGSQSILASLDKIPSSLTQSIEVDVSPVNKPNLVDLIDGVLGEGSIFHQTHGFYVHGVSIETAILPKGWKERCITLTDYMDENRKGYCLDLSDLAISKLMAFRPKDLEFVRNLVEEKLVNRSILLERLHQIDGHNILVDRSLRWIEKIT